MESYMDMRIRMTVLTLALAINNHQEEINIE